ncbi:hypothetical protein DVA86_03735 [Streptomyces armeniacus]|uniref:Bacterial transcriptional activator domain-containing protein n=1 Tax=Streptomyces armeniacus TaxID=83291 RepID=A0A345XZJ9_9ACTN|nr:hypothetical protein DVA86_03735 [Streptomyces armeniacus]
MGQRGPGQVRVRVAAQGLREEGRRRHRLGGQPPEDRLPQGRRQHPRVPLRLRGRAAGEPQGGVAAPGAGELEQVPRRHPRQADGRRLRCGQTGARGRAVRGQPRQGQARRGAVRPARLRAADGPVAALRAERAVAYRQLVRHRALALARLGRHAEAAGPLAELAVGHPRDEELVTELLRCEAVTVGTGAALARYDTYRRGLRDGLGTDPGAGLRAVHQELLRGAAVRDEVPVREGVPHEPNPLLGRDGDVAAVAELLRTSRVATVVGPGGLGKTRLAHVVAREAEQRVVHFVPLAGVTADGDVAGEVAGEVAWALGAGEGRTGSGVPTGQVGQGGSAGQPGHRSGPADGIAAALGSGLGDWSDSVGIRWGLVLAALQRGAVDEADRWPSRRGRRCRSAMSHMFSSPVIRLSTAENCPVTPIAARTASGSAARSWPPTRSSPPYAFRSPVAAIASGFAVAVVVSMPWSVRAAGFSTASAGFTAASGHAGAPHQSHRCSNTWHHRAMTTTHAFPAELVQAQRDWYTTYRRLADAHGTQTAVLRRELLRLSVRITTHPYWTTLPDAPAARMELKQTAWSDAR